MKRSVTISAFVLLFVFLLLSIALNIRQDHQANKKEKQLATLLSQQGQNKIVTRYTHDSIKHTVFKEKIINNTVSEKLSALDKSYADSLQKALKISIDKIDQVTKINASLVAELKLKDRKDANGMIVKVHKDKNLDLQYYPNNDSLKFIYDIELSDVRHKDRKWFLGTPQHYIDVFSNDKRVTINGMQSFRIAQEKSKRFGIGLQTGYGIAKDGNTMRLAPYFGIGLNYNLIEF